jgi:hypothetical protein
MGCHQTDAAKQAAWRRKLPLPLSYASGYWPPYPVGLPRAGSLWEGNPGAIAPTATTLRVQEISIFSVFTVTNIVLGAIPEDSVK